MQGQAHSCGFHYCWGKPSYGTIWFSGAELGVPCPGINFTGVKQQHGSQEHNVLDYSGGSRAGNSPRTKEATASLVVQVCAVGDFGHHSPSSTYNLLFQLSQ